jgi:hypothetical protein
VEELRDVGFIRERGSVFAAARDLELSRITFVGANPRSAPSGEIHSRDTAFCYLGPRQGWRQAPRSERLRYPNIYPGIDLVFVTSCERLEYNFEVGPHADPTRIRIHYQGVPLRLTQTGDLSLSVGNGATGQRHPFAFQKVRGRSRKVRCDYRFENGDDTVLRLDAYDSAEPLFIDPVLAFSTYLGGSGFDAIYGAASDTQGNLYVTGETSSGSLT